ncbi:MAG: hypothetical protein V7641_646 [Blastocatellia bacterium]
MAITNGAAALAQETPQPPAQTPTPAKPSQAPKAKVVPAQPATPRPAPLPRVLVTPRADEDSEAQATPLTMKVARNAHIAVSSRMVNVRITGVDGDTLEATATSDEGTHQVKAQASGDEANPKIMIYVPLMSGRRADRDVHLNIKLPRYATIEAVESLTGDIEVSGIDAPVAVNTDNGQITVVRVASLKASTRHGEITAREIKGDATARSTNGDLTLENIGGDVDVAATNGSLNVRNAGGDVRANLTVGEVIAYCIKGRAEVNTVSGSIQLFGVSGDVEAVSTSGEVTFAGRIRAGGRYKLKSISGAIEMHIQPDAPGFTATLITYNGDIETLFPLKLDSQASSGSINRRIIGRFGDGSAQLLLDSFNGGVRLAKAKAEELKACK